ncbi:3'(2'),5'-bisphosphate nucleotidase CysQ family protein [Chelatococcus asaccharovorans]|uniref:3'(2'),5'-bisphosphate nucleotidase CysQ family protein n=1 Tax=Chelatococcus asaccharovorans TaxID=28210 RepID=UPI00224C67C1|nr:3'(2'),5'-bisphosphate nucleotidase CysQ [Chelatococcus asaccharovorans]CAH1654062.1 3'(2'),5'-bisphosphate nucleotidase CysQ [Chelatococcus asaccharovorans]CAH1685857.1 3'(2'),5'-bisphosphate nucleotidase CysQ [Chelatococcus asaccharovorans]
MFHIDRSEPDALAAFLGAIAVAAGAAIVAATKPGLHVSTKDDGSPCTAADEAAEAAIVAALRQGAPDCAIVSEESAEAGAPLTTSFFVVDPLDGTRDFIAGETDFSVNIAAVRNGRPIAGAVFMPRLGQLYVGGTRAYVVAVAAGGSLPDKALWQPITTRGAPAEGLVALASRRHGDAESEALLARLPVRVVERRASALKFCLVASGQADIYPRFGPTKEWDTAAGEAILAAAGGRMVAPDGSPFTYGHAERAFLNGAFIAFGDPALAPDVLQPTAR